jgi:acyl-coenzyme A thioesterase PaaI-like protein
MDAPIAPIVSNDPFEKTIMIESVTSLPFNKHVGIEKSSTENGLLELPAGGQFLNHLGNVHASAQLALAEACAGEFLLKNSTDESVVAVVRRVEAKFKKPANGRLTAKIVTPLSSLQEAISLLATKGRCLVTIDVEIFDEHGQHSLNAGFEWFLAKQSSGS